MAAADASDASAASGAPEEPGAHRRDAGRAIVASSWAGNVVFALTAIPAAAGVDAVDDAAVIVALALFFASLVVWAWALLAAIIRTTHGDDVAVTTMFLLEGRVPARVRWLLYGALAACLAITVASAAANPFGVLVPMFPLGLIGLWGARHGTYPPRRLGASR